MATTLKGRWMVGAKSEYVRSPFFNLKRRRESPRRPNRRRAAQRFALEQCRRRRRREQHRGSGGAAYADGTGGSSSRRTVLAPVDLVPAHQVAALGDEEHANSPALSCGGKRLLRADRACDLSAGRRRLVATPGPCTSTSLPRTSTPA